MTAYKCQKEKFSKYISFDPSMPSGEGEEGGGGGRGREQAIYFFFEV